MKAMVEANREAFARIAAAEPYLTDVVQACEVVPACARNEPVVFHSGPDVEWSDMCGPMKGAVLGVCVYEGWVETLEQAEDLVKAGEVRFEHNHSIGVVGPMTGMVSRSMPLVKVENRAFGNVAYSTLNEGVGKVMRFGANGPEVLDRLRWLENEFAPLLKEIVHRAGGVDLRTIMAKALSMGDELHQRNVAASCLFLREALPYAARACRDADALGRASDFLYSNDQFFLNIAMASAKSMIDPIRGLDYCTLVLAMSRNGSEFGIKMAALGDRWFKAPAEMPNGLYFPGFTSEDANPDMGDSAIVECVGFGGMAMAAAPALTRFVGVENSCEAYSITEKMGLIAQGENPSYAIPGLDFAGVPTGIDVVKVVESGIRPYINSGIAHREPGIGQVGAGVVFPPMSCFEQALQAYAEAYGI